ncbi:bifunctional folylpolyglutamate synthase/dihydrofolate synthase [candidate division KSB1 bacterium]
MFQRTGLAAYKASLDNTIALCNLLNNPHNHFQSIHIAGSNGKGSVSHMLASVLQVKGLNTGLYTSPHFKDFRERIKINGKNIPRSYVIDFVEKNKNAFEKIQPSFFEMTFGLAIQFFADQKVDIAIFETGMGGRLDSTNVINPLLTVITNISFDHTKFLGNTLEKIASEKAGIIKTNTPVIIGESQDEIEHIFENTAEIHNAEILFADKRYHITNKNTTGSQHAKLIMNINRNERLFLPNLRCPLLGNYQYKNIITVMQIVESLMRLGYDIRKPHITKGLNDVIKNTGILGRWQVLSRSPLTICDVGHNQEGIKHVFQQIKETSFNQLHVVFGMVADKESEPVLNLLPRKARYYWCKANIPRGLDAETLKDKAKNLNLTGNTFSSVIDAYKNALFNANKDDLVFIGGSIFIVAEVL